MTGILASQEPLRSANVYIFYLEKLSSLNILGHREVRQSVEEVAELGNKALAPRSIPAFFPPKASGSHQQKEKA